MKELIYFVGNNVIYIDKSMQIRNKNILNVNRLKEKNNLELCQPTPFSFIYLKKCM